MSGAEPPPGSGRADATPESRRLRRRGPIIAASSAIVAVLLLGAGIALRGGGLPLALDEGWMERVLALRSGFWDTPALVMDAVGGGILARLLIPAAVLAVLLLLRRPWSALFFLAATIASALAVQGAKRLFGRPRPEDILVTSDFGSFPSGHVANAATVAVALALIIGRVWVWVVGALYVLLMALSRTYLGAHWLTDTLGGLVLGAAVAVIVWALLADRMSRERRQARAPGR